MSVSEQGGAGERAKPFGILLIDKPAGPTSHDLVAWVRWALRERSVGHCGTLDPAATGLLVVCVGAATKLVEHLSAVDKHYRARFVLGRSTTTADAEGETLAELGLSLEQLDDALDRAAAALDGLVGAHELPPPAYSAIKLGGTRAHELARAGEAPKLEPRPMTVTRLEIEGRGRTEDGLAWIDADLTVSKGTYVRSLAEELGRRVGLPAHLGALRRLACAELRVDDPLAVTGLGARVLPPRATDEGRRPRWRVEYEPSDSALGSTPESTLKSTSGGRERAGAALRARLVEPWRRLPFGFSDLQGADHRPLFERLLQGQRLSADPQTSAILGLPEREGPHALVERALGALIIVRREADGRGGQRIAPARVLRFDPRPPSIEPPDAARGH